MTKHSFPDLKITKKPIAVLLFILIFDFLLLSQNYLPEERKGDWLKAGYLRFLDKNLTISKINNVLDYGATNDGSVQDTNNQKAIVAAIEDRDSNGITLIYFPSGTYTISYRIRINRKKNIILRGDGSNKTRLIFYHSNVNHQPNIYMRKCENVGVENLYIERADNAKHGDNIRIKYSKKCWVSGVESYRAISNHIFIAKSKNIEIRGCHIHHAWDYGGGGHGYGVCLGDTATEKCLIENNIFNHLRHSVILSNGPTSNVIGYNYSTDPYTTETYLGISDWPSDMCLHGHPNDLPGPSRNLFEGNICAFMHADDAWHDNGPYNTYFRNRATYYGLKIYNKSPNQNIIANEVDDSDGKLWDLLWNAFNIQSRGNHVLGNTNHDPDPDAIPSPSEYSTDLSLYFDPRSIPEFLRSLDYWPPIGIVNSDRRGGGTIPAKIRWDEGGILTVHHPEHELEVLINNPPSFTKGADQTVLEDIGEVTIESWATAISAGPSNESGQSLSFSVTTDNDDLFAKLPAISASGILTFTPATNVNGSATVTAVLSDNGGKRNGGNDIADPQTFTITVNPVNDAPLFIKGTDLMTGEDGGEVTASGWATEISAGPSNESGQTLTFSVTTDNDSLFTQPPAISDSGTLTFTPAINANGSANVTVLLSDDGGKENGGDDTADAQTFTLTVNPVNDAPSFTKGNDQMVNEDVGQVKVTGWATEISVGPSNESGQTLSFSVTTDNDSLFAQPPAISDSGTLTFTPAINANGSANVTVLLSDDGDTANGGDNTADPQIFSITVNPMNDAPKITSTPVTNAKQDVSYIYYVNAEDIDGDTLKFTLIQRPEEMSIDSLTGLISWTPGVEDVGANDVTVQVRDNNSLKDEQSFTVKVDPSVQLLQKSNQRKLNKNKILFTNDIIFAVAPNSVCLNQNSVLLGTSYQGNASAFLIIYDALANIVFKDEFLLAGDVFNKGIKIFGKWNLKNNSGRQIAPGTYLAVLKIIGFSGNTEYVLKSKIGVSYNCE